MRKDKTVFIICIALIVGIIIGVLMCFVLQPFAGGASANKSATQDTRKVSVTTGFVDKTLAGTYRGLTIDDDVWTAEPRETLFYLYDDGTCRSENFDHATWKRYDDIVRISCPSTDGIDREFILYIVEDGLIYNNKLYTKQ